MEIIDKIVKQTTEPKLKNVLWLNPETKQLLVWGNKGYESITGCNCSNDLEETPVIPQSKVGPTDNEIWYKTENENEEKVKFLTQIDDVWKYVIPYDECVNFGDYNIIDHYYDSNTGYYKVVCDKPITETFWEVCNYGYDLSVNLPTIVNMLLPESIYVVKNRWWLPDGLLNIKLPKNVVSLQSVVFNLSSLKEVDLSDTRITILTSNSLGQLFNCTNFIFPKNNS